LGVGCANCLDTVAVGEQAVLTDGHTFQLTQPVPSAVRSQSQCCCGM